MSLREEEGYGGLVKKHQCAHLVRTGENSIGFKLMYTTNYNFKLK